MAKFDLAIPIVLGHEGGYVNDPNDPGGETKYGISKKQYPNLDIKNLTVEQAKEIYRRDYWLPIYDQIKSQEVATLIFDQSVLAGTQTVTRVLQRVLGIEEDGLFGPHTLEAVNNANPQNLMFKFRVKMTFHYCWLCVLRHSNIQYFEGWVTRLWS